MNNFKALFSFVVASLIKLLKWSLSGVFALTVFVAFMLIHLVVEITSDAYKVTLGLYSLIKSFFQSKFKVFTPKQLTERN